MFLSYLHTSIQFHLYYTTNETNKHPINKKTQTLDLKNKTRSFHRKLSPYRSRDLYMYAQSIDMHSILIALTQHKTMTYEKNIFLSHILNKLLTRVSCNILFCIFLVANAVHIVILRTPFPACTKFYVFKYISFGELCKLHKREKTSSTLSALGGDRVSRT